MMPCARPAAMIAHDWRFTIALGLATLRCMSWFYRTFARPALFAQDSEEIHDRTMRALEWASRREIVCDLLSSFYAPPELPVELFGLRFPNPRSEERRVGKECRSR